MSLSLSIQDPSVRRYVSDLERRIIKLEQLLNRVISDDGAIIAHLADGTRKSTSGGEKEVTAGAVTTLDSLDDVPDGSTHGRVANTELSSAKVKRIRKVTAGVDVDGDDIIDGTNNDADDLGESASRKWAGASGADFVKSTDTLDEVTDGSSFKRVTTTYVDGSGRISKIRKTAGDVNGDDVLDGNNNDQDDLGDGTTFKRVTGVSGSNQVQAGSIATAAVEEAKIAGGAVTQNKIGSEAVNNAKIASLTIERTRMASNSITGPKFDEQVVDEYQSMGSTLTDGQWDSLET